MVGGCMAEETPRLILDGDPVLADKFQQCDDCWKSIPEGTLMRKALFRGGSGQITQTFKSLDGRELSIDLRLNICPSCVVLNDLRRPPRDDPNRKEKLISSKKAYEDLVKKKTPVRKKK
jgi:hypothetical protein